MAFWSKPDTQEDVRAALPALFPRLWRYALTLTGSRQGADDLAQAACLRALERAHQFQTGTTLDRWVFRIAHNTWVSELRKEAVRKGGGLVAIEDTDIADPRQSTEDTLVLKELRQAVLHLPEAQRATVVLVYVEGYSYRDAAMILDVPLGTIMSRLATARATLGAKLRPTPEIKNAR